MDVFMFFVLPPAIGVLGVVTAILTIRRDGRRKLRYALTMAGMAVAFAVIAPFTYRCRVSPSVVIPIVLLMGLGLFNQVGERFESAGAVLCAMTEEEKRAY